MSIDIILIILVLVIGFYMLWNLGANDVANAVGTSVGSGAITLKKALIIAAVFEFGGAVFLGANVSETIQNGIVDPQNFAGQPLILVLGMIGSLFATALWLQVATYFRWPVSTTHSIVGSLLGFGVVVGGFGAVEWGVVGKIALSWVVAPSMSALIAYIFFSFLQRKILFAHNPLLAAKRIAPYLVFLVLTIFIFSVIANGLKGIQVIIAPLTAISISLSVALVGALICRFFCARMHAGSTINPIMAARQELQLFSLNKVYKHLMRAKLASTGAVSIKIAAMADTISSLIEDASDKSKYSSHINADYRSVEKIFAGLQIFSACFVAFGHGANDVANAIGPVSAVLQIVRNPASLGVSTIIPLWLLVFGGCGIVLGLATYGWRVIETIGHKITQLTPTRGFSAEFAAATTILVASKLGMPISTTHSLVGAVLGVGLARGVSALNFQLIRDIFLSWIVTIPSSAITSIILFYILKFFFIG